MYTSIHIYQNHVSGERLQDQWSSCSPNALEIFSFVIIQTCFGVEHSDAGIDSHTN